MSALTLAALVVLAPPQPQAPAAVAQIARAPAVRQAPAPARIRALRSAVDRALRESAVTPDLDADAIVPRLAALYRELRADHSLAETERERLLGKLKHRLVKIEELLVRRERINAAPAKSGSRQQPASVSSLKQPSILAQQLGPMQGAGFGGAGTGGAANGPNVQGGINLVELIQTTIAPETWDVNGGEGTITFFPPLNVMVVTGSW